MIAEMTLTKKDLLALKQSGTICLTHLNKSERNDKMAGEIRCIKRPSDKEKAEDPFLPECMEHIIPCNSWIHLYYAEKPEGMTEGEFTDTLTARSSHRIYDWSRSTCELWGVIATLREGDSLRLQWRYENTTDALREAGFAVDECLVQVIRHYKNRRDRELTYLVDVRVGRKDSYGRMIHS